MPASSDEPPSAATSSVENGAPSTTAEAGTADGAPAVSSPVGEEQRQPRRRRRRHRRRPPPAGGSPSAPVAGAPPNEQAPAVDGAAAEPQAEAQEAPAPRPPRRRRRRRRGPPRDPAPPQSLPAADAAVDAGGSPDPTPIASAEDSPGARPAPGIAGETRRPRRRRRRPPRPADEAALRSGNETSSASETIAEPGSRQTIAAAERSPRMGRPYPRRPREAGPQERDPRARGPRGARNASGREPGRRDRGSEDRGRRDRRSEGGPPGRGREGLRRQPDPKLYALESVVDRGFDDVPDDSDEGGTRRVHWTIVKRTVADQKTGKAMSARYALQREGVESEFPNLGAARAAVNKTIVHPEKLTLSKAEHVAAKGNR